jgi:hypothetical protein
MMTYRLKALALTAMVGLAASSAMGQYQYDPDDFATQVVSYHAGNSGHVNDWLEPTHDFKDPNSALGRPTVDTVGDDWYISMDEPVPVNPVYPAFRYYELCTVGYDSHREGMTIVYDGTGYLELKFGKKVFDNPLNPFGSDLIVFGNTFQIIGGGQGWTNGDPTATSVGPNVFNEPGAVLVSQDGASWYRLPDPGAQQTPPPGGAGEPAGPAPAASNGVARGMDDFAPTLGRVYDPDNPHQPDPNWSWNEWWGHPTNPTYPVDPSIEPADWSGWTVAEMSAAYKGSAGGAGLDLQDLDPADYGQLAIDPETGMKWIQYVRIEDPKDENGDYFGVSTEVDAVADVFARRTGDVNLDGIVGPDDLGILLENYLQHPGVDWWEHGDFNDDGLVDPADLSALLSNYGLDNYEYNLGGSAPTVQVIPEPGSLAILTLAGALMLRKRRGET